MTTIAEDKNVLRAVSEYMNDRISAAKMVKKLFELRLSGEVVGKIINEARVNHLDLPPVDMTGLESYKEYEEVYIPIRQREL